MRLQFSYKSVSEKDKKFLEKYVNKKEDRLQRLISEGDFENTLFVIRVEKFAKKEAYKVELSVDTTKDKFVASEDDHTVVEAFDIALDKLIVQLRKAHEKNISR